MPGQKGYLYAATLGLVAVSAGIASAQRGPASSAGPKVPPGRMAGGAEEIPAAVTLDELLRVALSASPNLREAASQAAAARGRAFQAGLYPNPTMGTAAPQLAGSQSQYNVYMSQDVVTAGKLKLDSSAAWQEARQADLALIRAHFDVLTTVRSRFYVVLIAQRRLEVLQDLLNISRKSMEFGQKLLKGGEGARPDALLLEIEYERSSFALQNAAIVLEASKRQLAAGVGVADLPIPRLLGDVKARLPDYQIMAVAQGVVSRNALAQMAQVQIGRSETLLERAKVEPIPNVNFLGGYQYQLAGAGAPTSQALYQVQFEVPLFDRNQGNIRAAQAGIATARAQLGRVQNDLVNSTAVSIGRYLAAQQQVERYEQQILPKAQETQRLTANLWAQGQIDFLRLLQAQRTLVEAELGYINAQEERWTSAAEVAGLLQLERFP